MMPSSPDVILGHYPIKNHMADTTIVNTPAQEGGAAGWFFALILILLIMGGGFVWYRYYRGTQAPARPSTTNINVTLPIPGSGGTDNPAGGTGN